MAQAAANALQHRLVLFAVKIIDLATCLPKTTAGRHIARQVMFRYFSRSELRTSARCGEPGRFVHKLRIAVKELFMKPAFGCSLS